MWIPSSCGTVDQLFTLSELLGILHVFSGLGEGLRLCPLGNPVGTMTGVWGTRAISFPCTTKVRASVFSAQSQTFFQWVLDSLILVVIFIDRISRCSKGVWFGDLRNPSLHFADDVAKHPAGVHIQ